MPTAKNNVAKTSTADAAFKRVKPILDRLQDDMKEARRVVGKEYIALDDSQIVAFRTKISTEYGWSDQRIKSFARIEKSLDSKKTIIEKGGPRAYRLDEFSTRTLTAICETPDKILSKAAKAGLFDKPVTSGDIIRFRKTGRIEKPVKKAPPKSDIEKIKALMVNAENHIRKASLDISGITALMYDAKIKSAKGKEARALIKSFEKLCLEISAANPNTSERAFKILRGTA